MYIFSGGLAPDVAKGVNLFFRPRRKWPGYVNVWSWLVTELEYWAVPLFRMYWVDGGVSSAGNTTALLLIIIPSSKPGLRTLNWISCCCRKPHGIASRSGWCVGWAVRSLKQFAGLSFSSVSISEKCLCRVQQQQQMQLVLNFLSDQE